MEDEIIICADCSEPFTFTVSERQFYIEKQFVDHNGFVLAPIRCLGCRRTRKQQRRQEEQERAASRW